MKVPWSRRYLILTERRFDDLLLIARAIVRGIDIRSRLLRVLYLKTLRRVFDDSLKVLHAPRRVLLVAHGVRGHLVAAKDGDMNKYVDATWWGTFDPEVEVFAFGCESASFVTTYGLAARCRNFVGYREKVRFFIGSPLGKRVLREVCAFVGETFAKADSIDRSLVETLQAKYDDLIREYGRTSFDYGRRLVLIELERQLESVDLCS